MSGEVGEAFREKAEREATRLLDEYQAVADTHEGVHLLITLGYMLGSQDGSREAVDSAVFRLRRAL